MLYRGLLGTLFFLLIALNANGQDEVSIAYKNAVEEGKVCLKEGKDDCLKLFYRSIDGITDSRQDSLVRSIYYDIYKELKEEGVGYDLVWKILQDGNSVGTLHPLYRSRSSYYGEMANTILDYGVEGDYMAYFDSAVHFAEQTNDPAVMTQILSARSRGLEVSGDISESIRELHRAKEYAEQTDSPLQQARVAMGLANAYNMNGDFELARNNLLEAADLLLVDGDTMRYFFALTNSCNVSMSLNEPEKVIDVLPECVAYFQSKGQNGLTPFPLTQLGRAHYMLENEQKAIPYLNESVILCEELGLKTQLAYNHLILAKVHESTGDMDRSNQYARLAYEHYSTVNESTEYLDAATMYANTLSGIGDHAKANQVLREFTQVKDSVFSAEKTAAIAEIQGLLELEKKENELCAQQNEIGLLEEEKRRIRIRNIALSIVLVLLGIIAWLLIKSKSAQIKLKEIENLQLEKDIEHKKRELASKALHLAQKNEFLIGLQKELKEASDETSSTSLVNKLKFEKQIDRNWDQFMSAYKETSPELLNALHRKHPNLTKKEVQLCALIRMGLSMKETASLLNVSTDAVKKARYRLRKKLNLQTSDSLEDHLLALTNTP